MQLTAPPRSQPKYVRLRLSLAAIAIDGRALRRAARGLGAAQRATGAADRSRCRWRRRKRGGNGSSPKHRRTGRRTGGRPAGSTASPDSYGGGSPEGPEEQHHRARVDRGFGLHGQRRRPRAVANCLRCGHGRAGRLVHRGLVSRRRGLGRVRRHRLHRVQPLGGTAPRGRRLGQLQGGTGRGRAVRGLLSRAGLPVNWGRRRHLARARRKERDAVSGRLLRPRSGRTDRRSDEHMAPIEQGQPQSRGHVRRQPFDHRIVVVRRDHGARLPREAVSLLACRRARRGVAGPGRRLDRPGQIAERVQRRRERSHRHAIDPRCRGGSPIVRGARPFAAISASTTTAGT